MPDIHTDESPRRRRPRPTATDAVLAAAAGFDAMLVIALGLVRAGRSVDLAGLEQEAARLCAAALGCPQACFPELRAALLPLLARLDTLGAAIRLA